MKWKLGFILLCLGAMIVSAAGPNLRDRTAQEALNVRTTCEGMVVLDMSSGTSDSTWSILEYDSTATNLYRWSVYSTAAEAAITAYYQYDSTGTAGIVTVGSVFPVIAGVPVNWEPSAPVDSIKVDRTTATRVIILGVY